jgi:hypothetical protein
MNFIACSHRRFTLSSNQSAFAPENSTTFPALKLHFSLPRFVPLESNTLTPAQVGLACDRIHGY